MREIRPTLSCPCDGAHREVVVEYDRAPQGETRFDLKGAPYRRAYDRCRLCDHWFARHTLDLSSLYTRAYVDATYGGIDGMRRRFEAVMALPPERSDNRQRAERVRRFAADRGMGVTTQPRLLDVGAGLGVFPAAMTSLGWDVTALEPDVRTVEHLQGVAGVRALAADLLIWSPTEAGTYDAVTFNKVLEHVEDPLPLVVAASRLLAPGGFIYVEVPDVAAADEGPGREEFFLEHVHVFSPGSLALLGERAGLRAVELERLREPSTKFTLRAFFMASPTASGAR